MGGPKRSGALNSMGVAANGPGTTNNGLSMFLGPCRGPIQTFKYDNTTETCFVKPRKIFEKFSLFTALSMKRIHSTPKNNQTMFMKGGGL